MIASFLNFVISMTTQYLQFKWTGMGYLRKLRKVLVRHLFRFSKMLPDIANFFLELTFNMLLVINRIESSSVSHNQAKWF